MVTDADVDAALRQERIRLHRKALPTSVGASATIGTVLAAMLWQTRPGPGLLVWLACLAAALALRMAVGWGQRRDAQAAMHAASWLLRTRLAFLAHGLVWASVSVLVAPDAGPGLLELVVFALAAITAGAFISIAFDIPAALCFAAPAVAAMLLAMATHADSRGMALWLMGLLFVAVTVAGARRSQRAVGDGVRLQLAAQKRAEEARHSAERADIAYRQLADQHQLMTQLLQTTRQGFLFIDNAARVTDLNPAMALLLGRTREEALQLRVHDVVVEDDLPLLQRQLAARAMGQAGSYEVGVLRPDGTRVHCLVHASPIHSAAGAQLGAVGIWTDISARRETEAALRSYELVVNSITDVVSVVDTQERYVLVNDAWSRTTGVPRAQALGRPSTQAAPSTVSPERRRALRECVELGQVRKARGKSLTPGQNGRLLETTYFPHRGDDGQVQYVAMLSRDITEQEQQRAALEAREAEQRALLDAFPGHIGRMDAQMVYTYANQRLAQLVGRTPDDVVGRTAAEVLGPQAAADMQPWVERALAGEVAVYEHRQEQAGGGEPVDVQVTLAPGTDPRTGAPAVYGFAIDISAFKRAERALRESDDELRALLAAFPGYIAAVNQHGVYTFISDRTRQVIAGQEQDSVGRVARDVLGEERYRGIAHELRSARAGLRTVSEKTYVLPPDGRRLDLEITFVAGPLQADGRQTTYAFGIDITARKQAQEALIAARDEAERANRAKSQFLSQMSHELRTPMNAILGFGQLLASDTQQPLIAQQQAWVQEILRGADHLLALINEILDLGRIEAGELVLEPGALDLHEMVTECLGLVQALATARSVRLQPAPGLLRGVLVAADRRRFKQVLLNLLGNAIKYNRAEGDVTVDFRREPGMLWLAVRDMGRGLSDDEQARLFQPFERLSAAQSAIEGTGIGLALSRRLVEAMGGQIGVDSMPGQGSTFWLRLPPARSAADALADVLADHTAASTGPAGAAPAGQPLRTVLYIEDNTVNVVLMEAMLARMPGLRVLSALLPVEGLQLARQERPALVLLDIQLPEMDGFEVLARLRADPATAQVPVVAVSANALQTDIDAAMAAGFTAYLTKPLVLDKLLDTVRRALNGH